MDITSFALGMLAMLGTILVVLTVVGTLRVIQVARQLELVQRDMVEAAQDLDQKIEAVKADVSALVDRRCDNIEQSLDKEVARLQDTLVRLDDKLKATRGEVLSYTDSRIDKALMGRKNLPHDATVSPVVVTHTLHNNAADAA